ncbi:hypothetical protein STAS_06218 [Striga asiatica]|uniref:Uncharacterized protein n=1 Tax=Striga asiatica TaxID=4170 RepID=A0A5A7PBR9_STRAF|nr:hypothetical protein STAS_06218 [Striga asiatica]
MLKVVSPVEHFKTSLAFSRPKFTGEFTLASPTFFQNRALVFTYSYESFDLGDLIRFQSSFQVLRLMEDPTERDRRFREHLYKLKENGKKAKEYWSLPLRPYGFWTFERHNAQIFWDAQISQVPGRRDPYDDLLQDYTSTYARRVYINRVPYLTKDDCNCGESDLLQHPLKLLFAYENSLEYYHIEVAGHVMTQGLAMPCCLSSQILKSSVLFFILFYAINLQKLRTNVTGYLNSQPNSKNPSPPRQ